MNKILIIGQAPPAVKQEVPYDTTLLYTMLEWVGISKSQAQEMFEFEAMSDKFPGFTDKAHKVPSIEDMVSHWNTTLAIKVINANKILVLGKFAKQELNDTFHFRDVNHAADVIYLIHPSRRNYTFIVANKQQITHQLNTFINH